MATEEKIEWRRSKYTTFRVNRIRDVLIDAGYHEECAVVPLEHMYSVIARTEDSYFNVRLDRKTLAIVETTPLAYRIGRHNRTVRVFRGK
jgi:hypothetical protein